MVYYDKSSPGRIHRPVRRRPLQDPPEVDEATRERILDEAERYLNFTAAELAASLNGAGVDVTTLQVRGVIESAGDAS